MNTTTGLVTPVNRFEADFGLTSEVKRQQVLGILRTFMAEIRQILDGSWRLARVVSPEMANRCATCAFNPVTDNLAGFGPTAYGLLWTIVNDKLFCCHGENPDWMGQHQVDPGNPILCKGFASVRLYGGTRVSVSALLAMKAIHRIVPPKT